MSKRKLLACALGAMFSASATLGAEPPRRDAASAQSERAAPGWIERSFARLERAIARLEAKISGRGGSAMGGCEDMMAGGRTTDDMMGGGMMGGGRMGGSQPNEQWRAPRGGR